MKKKGKHRKKDKGSKKEKNGSSHSQEVTKIEKKNGEVKKLNRNLLTNTTGNRRSVSVRNEHSNKFSSKEEEMNFWKTEVERLKKLLKRARRNVKRLENYTPENDKLDVDLTINRNHSDTTKIEEKKRVY